MVAWADEVFRHPESTRFFAEECQVECKSECMDGSKSIRPDRVVYDGSTWHVVDFKSGEVSKTQHVSKSKPTCRCSVY